MIWNMIIKKNTSPALSYNITNLRHVNTPIPPVVRIRANSFCGGCWTVCETSSEFDMFIPISFPYSSFTRREGGAEIPEIISNGEITPTAYQIRIAFSKHALVSLIIMLNCVEHRSPSMNFSMQQSPPPPPSIFPKTWNSIPHTESDATYFFQYFLKLEIHVVCLKDNRKLY